jgi:predicted transcriptional regulator
MGSAPQNPQVPNAKRRRSILDLAPLELDCMNALWPLGEASVREVQQSLVAKRPRAYTTIMTILDRLAHKGIVVRRKSGRAYLYSAHLSPQEARETAVERLVAGFFGGSRAELARHLGHTSPDVTPLDSGADAEHLRGESTTQGDFAGENEALRHATESEWP